MAHSIDDIEGLMVEMRLKEISDQIRQYKAFLDVEPGNILLINLLEEERKVLKRRYIRAVTVDKSQGPP